MRGISHSFPERAAHPLEFVWLMVPESSGVGGDCRMPNVVEGSLTSFLDGSTRYVVQKLGLQLPIFVTVLRRLWKPEPKRVLDRLQQRFLVIRGSNLELLI